MRHPKQILFEPWNLGDAVIAVATALQDPARLAVACNSRWHQLIRLALPENTQLELISVDLEYVNRGRASRFSLGKLPVYHDAREVLSIRGDVRDYWAAKRIFPDSKIRMNGWLSFIARRNRLVDLPFKLGLAPVRNRYRAWAELAGVDFSKIETFYRDQKSKRRAGPVMIHVGAQWRAKQFPFVSELLEKVRDEFKNSQVQLIAGPKDFLPDGISEEKISRRIDGDLVRAFAEASSAVTNDSGPMHLAAFMGCPTLVISRVTAIQEWLPPGVRAVVSPIAPEGYLPDPHYSSDQILEGWPTVKAVLSELKRESNE